MKVGQKIKSFREIRNYTQEYMANSLNMSTTAYGKIERDETKMTLTKLDAIAKVLDTDFRTITDFDEKKIFNITHADNAAIGNNNVFYNERVMKQYEDIIDHLKGEVQKLLEIVSNKFKRGE